jgi:hypothetical protein
MNRQNAMRTMCARKKVRPHIVRILLLFLRVLLAQARRAYFICFGGSFTLSHYLP